MQGTLESELRNFEILFPGGSSISFNDTDRILSFAKTQYPDWKHSGNMTSIPEVRVPRVFLRGDQMNSSTKRYFQTLLTGEEGEIKVYQKLMKLKNERCGILIFPNFNGKEIFCRQSSELHVEIDMILVHPTKGVFIFNVKNTQEVKEAEIKADMIKHSKFVRSLVSLNFTDSNDSDKSTQLPIHGVFCNTKFDSKQLWLKQSQEEMCWFSDNPNDKMLVFQKSDFKEELFEQTFWNKIEQIPSIDMPDQVDELVARLIVLSTMEGAAEIIHEKLVSGHLQTTEKSSTEKAEKLVSAQLSDVASEETKLLYTGSLERQTNDIIKVVIWTKEQLQVITNALKCFVDTEKSPTNKLSKLLIVGPKGSGKTMIMMYLKRVLDDMIKSHFDISGRKFKQLKICDGSFGNSALHFEFLNLEPGDILKPRPTDAMVKSDDSVYLLFDELQNDKLQILSKLSNYSFVAFSSETNLENELKSKKKIDWSAFEILRLSVSLRSTVELTYFQEKFRVHFLDNRYLKCEPKHNFRGTKPHVHYLSKEKDSVSELVTIAEESLKHFNKILIAAFTSHNDLKKLKSAFDHKEISYRNEIRNQFRESGPQNSNWKVMLTDGRLVDGCEFGAVIVLLSSKYDRALDIKDLFIVITRATIRLTFVLECSDSVTKEEEIAYQSLSKLSKQHAHIGSLPNLSNTKHATEIDFLEKKIIQLLDNNHGDGSFLFLSPFTFDLPYLFRKSCSTFIGNFQYPTSDYPDNTRSYYCFGLDILKVTSILQIQELNIKNIVYLFFNRDTRVKKLRFLKVLEPCLTAHEFMEYNISGEFPELWKDISQFFQECVDQQVISVTLPVTGKQVNNLSANSSTSIK